MSRRLPTRLTVAASVAMFMLAAGLLAGCAQTPATTAAGGATAQAGLKAAQSALSTTAPDAKLLVVQTAQAVSPTATPVWGYLFGSPSTDKTYVVYLSNGKSMGMQEYGTSGLSAADWKKVPSSDAWKVDSDVALSKAWALTGTSGNPPAYLMGFMTFKPKTDTSTVEPFVWSVQFDPGTSGGPAKAYNVNATTGAASVAK
jgi:hypothetical protein